MAETGWPLIPREVLPAPVPPAARNRRPQRAAQSDSLLERELPTGNKKKYYN